MGYDNENSLHTIQYIPGDTDPRTGGQLKTIPDDEIASVRLGGLWDKTSYVHAGAFLACASSLCALIIIAMLFHEKKKAL